MKEINKLPEIGERRKWRHTVPGVKTTKIMEGTVVEVSKRFGGQIHLTNVTSNDNFIVRLEQLL